MSGDEPFLARWSRRKRAPPAEREVGNSPSPEPTESAGPRIAAAPEISGPVDLPPIESIDSASDIRAFLAPGVPLALTRAALRRAWAADPAIRDFIGLSENSWDFNAPGGVPGFGSLSADDVRRLAAEWLRDPAPADAAPVTPTPDEPTTIEPAAPKAPTALPTPSVAAAPHPEPEGARHEPLSSRRHGGALPQ